MNKVSKILICGTSLFLITSLAYAIDFSKVKCPNDATLAKEAVDWEILGRRLEGSKCLKQEEFEHLKIDSEMFINDSPSSPDCVLSDSDKIKIGSVKDVDGEKRVEFTYSFSTPCNLRVKDKTRSIQELRDALYFRVHTDSEKRGRYGCIDVTREPTYLVVRARCVPPEPTE